MTTEYNEEKEVERAAVVNVLRTLGAVAAPGETFVRHYPPQPFEELGDELKASLKEREEHRPGQLAVILTALGYAAEILAHDRSTFHALSNRTSDFEQALRYHREQADAYEANQTKKRLEKREAERRERRAARKRAK